MENHPDDQVNRYTRSKLVIGLLALLLLLSLVFCYFAWTTFGPGARGAVDGALDGASNAVGEVGDQAGAAADAAAGAVDGAVDAAGDAAGAAVAAVTGGESDVKPPKTLSAVVGDTTMTLAGISAANAPINTLINGTIVGTTTSTPDGTWSVEFPTPPEGQYELITQIVSADGTTSLASQKTPLIVPAATAGAMADAGADAGAAESSDSADADAAAAAAEEQAAADAAAEAQAAAEAAAAAQAAAVEAEAAAAAVEAATTDTGAAAGGGNVNQPTMFRPLDFDKFLGGWLRVEGVAEPGSQVEVLVNWADAQTVNTDEFGNWAWVKEIRNPGKYDITAQVPGTSNASELSFTIPDNIQYATEADCTAGVAPFGQDLGTSYVVAPCEYLTLIALRVGIPYGRLLEANPDLFNRDYLRPGDTINLPSRP